MNFLLVSLAVWRLTSLLAREEGPFLIFTKLRDKLGVKYDSLSRAYGTTFFSKLILCPWCLSIWISAVCAPFLIPETSGVYLGISWYITYVFAISAFVIFFDSLIGWLSHAD